jgi:hypothetical protein
MIADHHKDKNDALLRYDVWCPVYSTLLPLALDVPCPQRPSSALPPSKIRDTVLWKVVSSFAECGAVPSAEARTDVTDARGKSRKYALNE